jgi:hypothetical protein
MDGYVFLGRTGEGRRTDPQAVATVLAGSGHYDVQQLRRDWWIRCRPFQGAFFRQERIEPTNGALGDCALIKQYLATPGAQQNYKQRKSLDVSPLVERLKELEFASLSPRGLELFSRALFWCESDKLPEVLRDVWRKWASWTIEPSASAVLTDHELEMRLAHLRILPAIGAFDVRDLKDVPRSLGAWQHPTRSPFKSYFGGQVRPW